MIVNAKKIKKENFVDYVYDIDDEESYSIVIRVDNREKNNHYEVVKYLDALCNLSISLKKTYYAVVEGKVESEETLKDYLFKDIKNNIVRVDKNGKEAILNYNLIEYKNDYSLVKINLKTGRSHQIRVQFSSRNHALYGDQKYNKNAKVGEQIALFAKELELIHPTTKELMKFSMELKNKYPWNLFK